MASPRWCFAQFLRQTLVLASNVAYFGEEWKKLENEKGGGSLRI
jgi:hypothetical protein